MKVLDIYSKKDLDLITFNGKLVSDLIDSFFIKFLKSYREIYDKNLETLEMYWVDEMVDVNDSAQYYPTANVLMFKSFSAIPHELMHLCSSDRVNKRFAFCRDGEYSLFEDALVEGMTEYLSCVMKDGNPDTYFFEFFVVSMLPDIDRISDSVKSTIDNLIDIELSFDKNMKDRKLYGNKFMDLISNSDVQSIVGDVCPEYLDYAYHEIKKKILRRKR